jgi:PAS domain S-box-containing protein
MSDRPRSSRPGLPAFAPAIGLREVLESSPDLVFSTDPWGRLVWASSAFEAFTGRRVRDCIGRPCAELIAKTHVVGILRAFKRGQPHPVTLQRAVNLVKPDGSMFPIDVRMRFLDSPDGDRYLVGVARVRDVSQPAVPPPATDAPTRLVIETAAGPLEPKPERPEVSPVIGGASPSRVLDLETRLAEAKVAAQVKGDFLATMSHEFRTPMSGVIAMTNLLLQNDMQPESRQLVELIRESSETLLTLINDTLDYSRLEAGKMPVEHLDFDLRVAVDQICGVVYPLAEQKSLKFDFKIHPLVPSRLQGDPGRLRQVLLNLASNAVKFTEQGTVSLRIEREAEDDQQVSLRFAVADTGPGIDPEALPRLFEPYAQASDSVASRYGGSGLGLAISRRLVEAMGGSMGVDNRPGEGCTFWFKVRLEKQPVTIGANLPPVGEVALRGVRVLVADAHDGERDPLVEVLRAWGCVVESADSGTDALRRVREAAGRGEAFAVALLDRHLEGLNGEELGQAIRADQALSSTRLVMITNVGRPGDGGRVKAAGFAGYLMKPLEPAQLYEALGEIMNQAPGLAAGGQRPLVTRHSLAEARRGKLRLLLVDDDPINQLVTTSALHRVGYNVDVASSGRRAIELTEAEHWDLILMDMQMPDLDGCRTTSAIRARERGAWRTPIIGLTANADHKPDRERCLAAGMDLVLGKPVDLTALTTTVERYTSRDGRVPEADPAPLAPSKLTIVSSHFDAPPLTVSGSSGTSRPARASGSDSGEDDGMVVVPEGPALDLEQLEAACMGLPALRSSLLHTFLHDVTSRLERLRQAFESSDGRRVEFEAHGLKGMCATIGANGCVMLFTEIEARAREDRVPDAKILLQSAVGEVERTEQFIRRFDAILSREAA